jgi:hypothetical protein
MAVVIERFAIFLVKARLVKRLGRLESSTATVVLDTLGELFAP